MIKYSIILSLKYSKKSTKMNRSYLNWCYVKYLQNHVRYSEEQISIFKHKCYDVHVLTLDKAYVLTVRLSGTWYQLLLSLSFQIMKNHYLSWWVVSDTSYNFAKVGNNFCVVIRSPASSSFQRQRQKTTKTIFVLSTVLNNGVHFRKGNFGQVRTCFRKYIIFSFSNVWFLMSFDGHGFMICQGFLSDMLSLMWNSKELLINNLFAFQGSYFAPKTP